MVYHPQDYGQTNWYEGQWNKESNKPEGVGIYVQVGFNFINFIKEVGLFNDKLQLISGTKYDQYNKTITERDNDKHWIYSVDGNVKERDHIIEIPDKPLTWLDEKPIGYKEPEEKKEGEGEQIQTTKEEKKEHEEEDEQLPPGYEDVHGKNIYPFGQYYIGNNRDKIRHG